MKIAICDDRRSFADRIKDLITEKDVDIYVFESGENLLNSNINFDIVLLDIEMPGMDGLNTAAELYKRNKKILLLFITSHSEYSTKGYEFRAFRYVLKSEPDEFIKRNIQDAIDEYRNYDFYITMNYKGTIAKVLSTQIVYMEAFGHTVTIHTKEKEYIGQNKFKDMCLLLSAHGFVRCHKSYTVNMRYIQSIEKNVCINTINGLKIPIGRKFNTDVINSYLEFEDGRI